jgi:hypothetical protein
MATHTYHKVNFLKWRIMECFYKSDESALTCKQIATLTGIDLHKVESAMSHYHRRGYPYFMRLPKKVSHSYRYKMNGYGYKWYAIYLRRIKLGFDLRCKTDRKKTYRMKHFRGLVKIDMKEATTTPLTAEELEDYIGLTKAGVVTMGFTEAQKLQLAGIQTS